MELPHPLYPARLVKRYKRFLADATLEETGETVTAHVANPGSMLGLAEPETRILLSRSEDPKRKLPWSWELTALPGDGWCGVNTGLPNRIVEEALRAGKVAEAAGYASIRREVRYGQASRVDFLAEAPQLPPLYIEVKAVTLSREAGLAEFPDAVTKRGAKHLGELAEQVRQGARALMLYLVHRDDCDRFALAGDIDPAYLAAYNRAQAQGVETAAYACRFATSGATAQSGPATIRLDHAVPILEGRSPNLADAKRRNTTRNRRKKSA